jgi:hypothetical protein
LNNSKAKILRKLFKERVENMKNVRRTEAQKVFQEKRFFLHSNEKKFHRKEEKKMILDT